MLLGVCISRMCKGNQTMAEVGLGKKTVAKMCAIGLNKTLKKRTDDVFSPSTHLSKGPVSPLDNGLTL